MPYISVRDQEQFAALTQEIDNADIKTAGELNFLMTKLALRFIANNGHRYQQMNDVMGALEGAKTEFYRRLVAPYENQKAFEVAEQDGDPYLGVIK